MPPYLVDALLRRQLLFLLLLLIGRGTAGGGGFARRLVRIARGAVPESAKVSLDRGTSRSQRGGLSVHFL